MMKKFLAGITAAVIAAPMFSVPITAEAVYTSDELRYYTYNLDHRYFVNNLLNINVTDPDGNEADNYDTIMKLFDSSGLCIAKFNLNYTVQSWNGSDIDYAPSASYLDLYTVDDEEILAFVPQSHELIYDSVLHDSMTMSSGEEWDVQLWHDDSREADLVLSPESIGIYVSPNYANKTDRNYLRADYTEDIGFDDEKYYFHDILAENGGFKEYSLADKTYTKFAGMGHTVTPDIYETESEYILCKANISEIIEEYDEKGNYTWVIEDDEDPETLICNLSENYDNILTSLLIVSGSIINAVVPDENGNVEFYVENSTREYYPMSYLRYDKYYGELPFTAHPDGYCFSRFSDSTTVTITNPVIPADGITLKNLLPGDYILKFEEVPEGCAIPEPMAVTVTDSKEVQTVNIQLEPYTNPEAPEPTEPDYILYNENVLNVCLKNQDGKYVSNGKLRFSDGENYIESTSGGTGFTASEDCPYTWHESLKWTDKSYTFEQIEKMSGLDDVFAFSWEAPGYGKRFKNSERYNNSSAPIEFDYGETRDITIYTKDDSEPTLITLSPLTTGIYVDEKWRNDLFTSYLIKDDIDTGEVVYFAPDGDDSVYGNVTYQSIDSGIYLGVCPKGTVPDTDTYYPHTSVYPYERGLTTEYILKKVHISELYDFVLSPEEESCFMNDGTFVCDDYLFNPRENDADAYMSIMIVSGGMISNVIPDEEGFVEFYLEKGDREYDMYISAISTASNAELSFKAHSKGICADSLTFSYQSAKLPDIGAVYTNLPAGEYTLTISDLPEEYRVPEDMTVTVDSKAGVQLLEITLENKCTTGDIDQDDDIDLDDALLALTHYAAVGSDMDSPLNAAQQVLADTNMDGRIDLNDALNIVSYYAHIGSDGEGTFEDFMATR